MSLRIPAAVTSAPAPGPLTTSGSVRYRRVVNDTRFRVPCSAPTGARHRHGRQPRRHRFEAWPRRCSEARGRGRARASTRCAHSSSNADRRSRNSLERHILQRFRHEILGRRCRPAVTEQPRQNQALPRRITPGQVVPGIRFGVAAFHRLPYGIGEALPAGDSRDDEHQRSADATLDSQDAVAGFHQLVIRVDDRQSGANCCLVQDVRSALDRS